MEYAQSSLETITVRDLLCVFERIWKTDAVQNIKIEGNPDKEFVKNIIHKKIRNSSKTIIRNVDVIRKCLSSTHWIKSNSIVSIDDLIEALGDDNELNNCYSAYYEKMPKSLFKYVSFDYACDSVIKSHFKCGTAKEYGFQDPRDSIALLDYKEAVSEDDFYSFVLGEVVSQILEERNVSIEDRRKGINDVIGSLYYIGCLCDNPDSKYMWDNYGTGGICIEFDVSGKNPHKVTYSDTQLDAEYIREKFRVCSEIVEYESTKHVREQFIELLKLIGAMGLLNLYRKDHKFHVESEWRLLLDLNQIECEKGIWFPSAPIIRVISDLPEDEDSKLREYCKGKIRYERRVCPKDSKNDNVHQ